MSNQPKRTAEQGRALQQEVAQADEKRPPIKA